jgi:hypothetical protein
MAIEMSRTMMVRDFAVGCGHQRVSQKTVVMDIAAGVVFGTAGLTVCRTMSRLIAHTFLRHCDGRLYLTLSLLLRMSRLEVSRCGILAANVRPLDDGPITAS